MSPAYRADQVGSYLRPQDVIDAHNAFGRGELPLEKLREIEDRAILDVLKMQKEVGIDVLSDGEFRRSSWAGDFQEAVEGYVEGTPAVRVQMTNMAGAGGGAGAGSAVATPPAGAGAGGFGRVIGGKLRRKQRLTGHESEFVKQHADGKPWKVTMPAATYVVARAYKPGVTDKVYSGRAEVLKDAAAIIRQEIEALMAEGTPYIQLDNPHYPDYIPEDRRQAWRDLGIDPDKALAEDIAADNASMAGFDRSKAVLAMHLCRGNGGQGRNRPAGWHTAGAYDRIAEQVFGTLDVDRFLLEYDDPEREGGFEPLRFVPKGKIVVLGLVTTKSGELETQDTLLRRIEEASKYVATEYLALSPQCGFASTMPGNPLSEDEQRRKLELVVNTARKVWKD